MLVCDSFAKTKMSKMIDRKPISVVQVRVPTISSVNIYTYIDFSVIKEYIFIGF